MQKGILLIFEGGQILQITWVSLCLFTEFNSGALPQFPLPFAWHNYVLPTLHKALIFMDGKNPQTYLSLKHNYCI